MVSKCLPHKSKLISMHSDCPFICFKSWIPLHHTKLVVAFSVSVLISAATSKPMCSAPLQLMWSPCMSPWEPFTPPRMCSLIPFSNPCLKPGSRGAHQYQSQHSSYALSDPRNAIHYSTPPLVSFCMYSSILSVCHSMILCKSPFGSEDIVHTLDKFLIIQFILQMLKNQKED